MDAATDYAAAARALANRLPAYVSYVVHSTVSAGPARKDESTRIVVRSSDGKIVEGTPPKLDMGADAKYQNDVVGHPPFDPGCYAATGAGDATFEGSAVEALSLRNTCGKKADTDGDFTTLYIDRRSREPVAAVGSNRDDQVAVRMEQRFARVGAFVLPSALDVSVKGSGFMFWLNVTGHQSYDGFAFSDTAPS